MRKFLGTKPAYKCARLRHNEGHVVGKIWFRKKSHCIKRVHGAPFMAPVIASAAHLWLKLKSGARRLYRMHGRKQRYIEFDLDQFSVELENAGVPFKIYFRLTRELMDELIERLTPHLRVHETKAWNCSGHCITPAHRVAAALRFMAGGQWQDICLTLRPISKAEVYKSLRLVIDAIRREYHENCSYPMPDEDSSAEEINEAHEFYAKREVEFRQKSPEKCLKVS